MIEMQQLKVAIIGSGNIGTDLMIKVVRHGKALQMGAMVGVDAQSELEFPWPWRRASLRDTYWRHRLSEPD